MRFRYLVFSLLTLLSGCSSLCPIRHANQSAGPLDHSATSVQPLPTTTSQPTPLTPTQLPPGTPLAPSH
jgi:uncharacterized protein YceK